jgi:hypothetical protein
MGTGKRRINSAARLEAKAEEAPEEPVARVELAEPVGQEALVELAASVGQEALAELAEPVVQVASGELELGPVAARELELGQAEEPLGLGQAEEPLERGPVAAELEQVLAQVVEPEQRVAQLVVALRTKSVTAAHRRDLVPLLEAEEDLAAAVAETTREPAAAEAVIAWEVAE